MIRFTMGNLVGASPYPPKKAVPPEESFRRSEEQAVRLSDAIIAATDRVPHQFRKYASLGFEQMRKNNPEKARRAFETALEHLPQSAEFHNKRVFIEREISRLPSPLMLRYQLHTSLWRGVLCMAIPTTAIVVSMIRGKTGNSSPNGD